MNGSFTGSDPAAITHWSKLTVFAPSGPSTRMLFGPVNVPTPETTVTFRPFASPESPPVSFLTTLSFQPRSPSISTSGFANFTPKCPISSASEITFAACSSAFDGMQPTFRQTPPSFGSRSISTTLSPRSAARNAAV